MALLGTRDAATALAMLIGIVAAITDQRSGRIPNWLTLPAILLVPCIRAVFGGFTEFFDSAVGSCACGFGPALVFVLTRGRGIGGGDVKLFAALGACLGAGIGIEVQLGALFAVAAIALGQQAIRGRLWRTLYNVALLAVNALLPWRRGRAPTPEMLSEVRMGLPIAATTVLVCALRRFLGWS